jgi:hypothetical protein
MTALPIDLPPVEAVLTLARELREADLREFSRAFAAHLAESRNLSQRLAGYLLQAAFVGVEARVQEALDKIREAGCWPEVRRELGKLVEAAERELDDGDGDAAHTGERDLSAFIPAKLCRNGHIQTPKQLTALLGKAPEIRREHRGQRLYVHAGDWSRWNAEQERQEAEALDRSIPEVQRAMTKERAKKTRRK